MSWQAYVDETLMGPSSSPNGIITRGAIHGLDGNPWATSGGFSVTPAEAKVLIGDLTSGNPTNLQSGGIRAGGVKYMFIRHDPTDAVAIGKKPGEGGIVVAKTGQCIIIGVYDVAANGGDANKIVMNLHKYLKDSGY